MHSEVTANNPKLAIVETFVTHQPALRDAIHASCPTLALHEVQSILSELSTRLREYRPRQFDERAAFRWMRLSAIRQAKRREFLTVTIWQHRNWLQAAAERGMYRSAAEDWAYEVEDSFSDLLLRFIQEPELIDALLSPGRAKLSTRLWGLMFWQTRGFRTKVNRGRDKFLKSLERLGIDPDDLGSESMERSEKPCESRAA